MSKIHYQEMACGGCGCPEHRIETQEADQRCTALRFTCVKCKSTTVVRVSASIKISHHEGRGDGTLAPMDWEEQ